MYRSLSDFIARLERAGELRRIAVPVDPVWEIAEITDRMAKSPGGGKALLFERTGTAFPVATNLMGSPRRMAMALGVGSLDELTARIDALLREATTPRATLWEKLRMLPLLHEASRWMPRRSASRGACQEVVLEGDAARLSLLPVLKCWGCDGGRFVTLPMVHTVDPESGVPNVGMYRMQLFDDRTTGMHWHVHKTGARHYDAYRRLGRRMPVTVALGGDPVYAYAATAPMPDNMDEYLLAGFLRRRPVRLVRCLTNDLWVPADCDFVIEGYVDPSEELATEGPFGDHTGFYSLEDRYPRFHVTAVTHRRDAVWPATVVGIPPQEDAYIAEATERIFLAPIRLAVQPEVRDLWMPGAGVAHNLAVVSIDRRYEGQAFKAAQALWGAGQMMFNKLLVVAPAAADIRNPRELAALLRGVDVERDVMFSQGVLDVLDHATPTPGFGGKLLVDLTTVVPAQPFLGVSLPAQAVPAGGVAAFAADHLAQWGVLVLFGARELPEVDAAEFLRCNAIRGVKCAVVFDREAEGLTGYELLWLAAANCDPARDVQRRGGVLLVDARSKRPGAGRNPARFPNVVCARPEVIDRVDARWAEYGLGERLESPSRRYRRLLLSDKAAW